MGCRASVAAIASSIMVARSPASAIAVVKELRAKGPFTSTLLGTTVMCDVVVLLLFTLTTTIAESECTGEGFSGMALLIMVGCILASLTIGGALGWLLVYLMWFKRLPTRYLILPLGLAVFVACNALTAFSHDALPYVVNLEPLLICIAAGYVCTNTSRHRGRFIGVLQESGPYVFLPFFVLTGASLDLRVMAAATGFALIVAAVRAAAIFAGSGLGGWVAGQSRQHNLHIWMTLLTQAGVSLGLASEVGMSFPGWGRAFQSSIIAVVVINQLIGPILFKLAVRRVGEAGAGSGGEGHEESGEAEDAPAALLLGGTREGAALALRLLRARWRVVLIAADEAEAARVRGALRAACEAHEAQQRGEAAGGGQILEAVAAGAAAAVAEVRGGVRALRERVEGAGKAAGGGGAAAGVAPAAPAGAASAHAARRLDDALEVVPLLQGGGGDAEEGGGAGGGAASGNPFLSEAAALSTLGSGAGAGGGGGGGAGVGSGVAALALPASGGGVDHRWSVLVARISSTRNLAAAACALGSDAANFAAARTLVEALAAAPRRSHLRSLRLASILHSGAWARAFQELGGGAPLALLHAGDLACAAGAAVLTGAPGAAATAGAPGAGSLAGAPADWRLLEGAGAGGAGEGAGAGAGGAGEGEGAGGRAATQLPPAVEDFLAARRRARAGGGGSGGGASAQATGGGSTGGLAGGLASALEVEEVPAWQRQGYLDALGGLAEHTALDARVLHGRASGDDGLQMYGSVSAAYSEQQAPQAAPGEEAGEQRGRARGLATEGA